ncbi:hypothetical protein DICSQDRAFT_168046 [Dichomitus squalens LYAD-421 SS1]|uniref:uncharacterized protein n=1 Tax=Dichomitus squalens (strain LYAD-421) TaxID=732165 RepID=UPI0004412ABD|nr:uncharacterized protein DICSQDRAFT_168046 [Dichomitus squalens LYAD-421 SS1]EJF63166.1 hypothetical protein DICSQDRAFT_168046 [Dichomitus squalens LYAD-421 SS1]
MLAIGTQFHTIFAILATFPSPIPHIWLFCHVSIIVAYSLLPVISDVIAQGALETISDCCGIDIPLFLLLPSPGLMVVFFWSLEESFSTSTSRRSTLSYYTGSNFSGTTVLVDKRIVHPGPHKSPILAERNLEVLIAGFNLTGVQRNHQVSDLTAELAAARHTIASMTARTAALREEKDDALTRANTLENAKESWKMREKALLATIEDLEAYPTRFDDMRLQARLQETERMLAHEIALRASAEDELTRYRDVAQAQLRELRASEKENTRCVNEQAIEIAMLKAQLLAMQQFNLAALGTKPRRTVSTFPKFWKKRRDVKVDLGISSSTSSRTITYTLKR